jgi:tRNA threonylcarbamoyladenosine biosynthesis protein TsaB
MGSIAVVDGPEPLCELTFHMAEKHSAQLMPAVDYVLNAAGCGLDDLDGFAVALGPGSFTGLRIGMSTLKGLAAATSKPLVGVSTLEAMAWEHPHCTRLICPMLDARMKEVYAAWFESPEGEVSRLSGDLVMPVAELLESEKRDTLFLGTGAERYREEIVGIMGERAHFITPQAGGARASIVGFLGAEKLGRGEVADLDSLEPLYIREAAAVAKLRDGGPAKK